MNSTLQKIEMKVSMHCERCKTQVFKAVSKLPGIDQVMVDLERQMLTVIGVVDPVAVTCRVRKIGKVAKIISVGPPRNPAPTPAPPPGPSAPPLPPCCRECQLTVMGCFIL